MPSCVSPRPAPESDDPCFVALARAEGADPAQLTAGGARTVRVALANIRRACPGVDPGEIARRAQQYVRVMPRGTLLTAPALAKHWARCAAAAPVPRAGPQVEPEPAGWRAWIEENCPHSPYATGGDRAGDAWREVDPSHRRAIVEQMARDRRPAAA